MRCRAAGGRGGGSGLRAHLSERRRSCLGPLTGAGPPGSARWRSTPRRATCSYLGGKGKGQATAVAQGPEAGGPEPGRGHFCNCPSSPRHVSSREDAGPTHLLSIKAVLNWECSPCPPAGPGYKALAAQPTGCSPRLLPPLTTASTSWLPLAPSPLNIIPLAALGVPHTLQAPSCPGFLHRPGLGTAHEPPLSANPCAGLQRQLPCHLPKSV